MTARRPRRLNDLVDDREPCGRDLVVAILASRYVDSLRTRASARISTIGERQREIGRVGEQTRSRCDRRRRRNDFELTDPAFRNGDSPLN